MHVLLAFLVGFVASYLAIVAGGILYMEFAGIVDRDGGMTMGIVFTLGPLGALIGGASAALAASLYQRRPRDATARQTPASRPRRIVLAAAIAGVAAYLAAAFGVWLLSGSTFESYWTAFLIVWSPYLLGLCAAALAALIAAKSPPSP